MNAIAVAPTIAGGPGVTGYTRGLGVPGVVPIAELQYFTKHFAERAGAKALIALAETTAVA